MVQALPAQLNRILQKSTPHRQTIILRYSIRDYTKDHNIPLVGIVSCPPVGNHDSHHMQLYVNTSRSSPLTMFYPTLHSRPGTSCFFASDRCVDLWWVVFDLTYPVIKHLYCSLRQAVPNCNGKPQSGPYGQLGKQLTCEFLLLH